MHIKIDVAIIGAGVIGLAIASEIAQQKKDVFVLEKNHTFGLETSSRQSEVIHAGIYYPEHSLRTKLCIKGRSLLYKLCDRHDIAYKKLGKIIVAANENGITQLEKLYEQGRRNGIEDLMLLSRTELKRLEPNVEARAGLLSPSSGILDSHSLQKFFYRQARAKGAKFVFKTEVIGIEKAGTGYKIQIRDIDKANYRLHYCKGEYFTLSSKYRNLMSRLIYPTPEQAGLGIHVTLGFDGRIRLGPNARYVETIDYGVDKTQKEAFYNSARKFLPMIELGDLAPEFAGIRPKLQTPGGAFRDFVIAHEEQAGFPGLINLIGIESPGLTAAPAIAQYVGRMVKELLG
jgi:L-2-hydroxyglutarate oxidase LhgO